ADLRPNIWVATSKFTGNDFSLGVQRFLGSAPITPDCYKPADGYDRSIEVLLFNRDVVRCFKKKKVIQFARWLFDRKLWKFIPTYDSKVLRYQLANTSKDIWSIVMVYLKTNLGFRKNKAKKNNPVT